MSDHSMPGVPTPSADASPRASPPDTGDGESLKDKAATGFEWFFRAGYVAKGAVYISVGIIAARMAIRTGTHDADARGALHHIFAQPYGAALLAVLTVGLAAYAIWRFAQAILDADCKGWGFKGICLRLFYLGSGLVYSSLCIY